MLAPMVGPPIRYASAGDFVFLLVAPPENQVQSSLHAIAQEVIELHYARSYAGQNSPDHGVATEMGHNRSLTVANSKRVEPWQRCPAKDVAVLGGDHLSHDFRETEVHGALRVAQRMAFETCR